MTRADFIVEPEAIERLRGLWADALNLPSTGVGPESNFWLLGGNSFRAMHLVARTRGEGLRLKMIDVWEAPTLAAMAARMEPIATAFAVKDAATPFSLLPDGQTGRQNMINLARKQFNVAGTEIEDIYPCTPWQQAILPSPSFVNYEFDLAANVNHRQFKAAWDAVVDANPILRTRFLQGPDGCIWQVVLRHAVDWDRGDTGKPWELWQPCLRLALAQGTANNSLSFRLMIHRAVTDDWALHLLLNQVADAYNGGELSLRPFNHFTRLASACGPETALFWADQFKDCSPGSFPEPPSRNHVMKPSVEVGVTIPLQRSCTDTRMIATRLQLSWAVLLSLYTQNNDVVFGVTSCGRTAATWTETVTGPTTACYPLRVLLDSSNTVGKTIRDMQMKARQAAPYEHVGLQHILRVIAERAKELEVQSLLHIETAAEEFPAIFTLHDTLSAAIALGQYAISLSITIYPELVVAKATVDPDVIPEPEAQRLLYQLRHIYHQTGSYPTMRLADIDLVSPEDQRELQDWNGRLPAAIECCVHEAIEEQCRIRPRAPAVHAWDGSFSYSELEAEASILACTLARHGVGPGAFTGLYFERTRWTAVAVLGILKAGGAIMMLDPSHPVPRLQEMCRRASTSVVLASTRLEIQAAGLGPDILIVGDNATGWKDGPSSFPASRPTPDHPLYVCFTSGSTGRPKGAVITHRAFYTNARANCAHLGLSHESRVLQFSSHAFDVSVGDYLFTFFAGGCLCIPSDQDRMFNLHDAITQFQANWTAITPSMARSLTPRLIPSLATVACIGEPMARGDIDIWPTSVRVINMYGPAECSVITTFQENTRNKGRLNNIGYARAAVCWIVDQENHHRLMPIGTVGELLVEGPIVGAEYLGQPDTTASSFIQPPCWLERFRSFPGRLYKTGDLVRYCADGTMTYVARKDTQVKLRGQRIELEEVEYHVKDTFPGAKQVVAEVIKPESGTRPPVLLAFILCEPTPDLETGLELFAAADTEFRKAAATAGTLLASRVPPFMIPAAYVPLTYLPQTNTNKLDRRMLRETASTLTRQQIDQYGHDAPTKSESNPSTAVERVVQQLFAQILQIPANQIGVNDHFFRLGGDSILAVQLVAAAHGAGYSLAGPDIFDHPTVRDLAATLMPAGNAAVEDIPPFSLLPAHIPQDQVTRETAAVMGLRVEQIQDIYSCTPMQEGLMALSTKSHGMYTEIFHYYLREDIDLDRFRRAFDSVVAANSILRTRMTSFQGQCLQVVVDEQVPLAVCRETEDPGLLRMGLNRPLLDPALRVNPPCLVLRMHHAIYDGQSLPVLWSQIVSAYHGSTLAPCPFNRYIGYLERASGWEAYWRSQFAGLDAPIFPRLPSPSYTPTTKTNLLHRIEALQSQPTSHTLSTAIRLAWAVSQSTYTDSNDVLFGVVADGRRAPFRGIEKVSGPTVASYPLRVQLNPDTSIEKTLTELQAQIACAFPHEHAGLQNIRKLSSEAALACDFQCQLGIQPELEAVESPLASHQQYGEMDYGNFSSYALVIVCHPQRLDGKQHMVVAASYDNDVVDPSMVTRILGHFENSLRYILQHPGDCIRQIPATSPSDWQEVAGWNGILPQSMESCLHDLVLRNCKVSSARPAVSAWDGDWDYGMLASMSSRMARYLQEKGVATGAIVPVCFEKSKWAVLAMMGVLRAGAAVTAIDPKHPPSRISQIIAQTNPPIVLASAATAHVFTDCSIPVVTVPFAGLESCEGGPNGPMLPVESSVAPNDPAFIVFTSGSTGQPKGIVLEHRNLCTSIRDHSNALGANLPVRGLHFASYAFDASIYELFTVLSNGGCVCIPSESQRLNGIEEFIEERSVNWAIFSPSTLQALQPDRVPSLQTLVLGGEPLTIDIARTWGSRLTLINGYGPAEATICAAGPVSGSEWRVGTIGSVTGGVGWITRRSDPSQLVPIGVVGELLIEGPVVSRGYLNGPNGGFIDPPDWLTRFRSGKPGRVYRTGDLVRYVENGSICFVGRNDSQVKLRGQRIELHEVEHAVGHCFNETNVAVELLTLPGQAKPALVAFVKEGAGKSPDAVICPSTPTFRSRCHSANMQLASILPAYMVPSTIIPLYHLPLTTGGKLDRNGLRLAVASLSAQEISGYSASGPSPHRRPSSAVQEILHDIWAKVLSQDPQEFGVEDSFFRLGGDSISAMQVVSAAHRAGLSVSVAQITRYKTISSLSVGLESSGAVRQASIAREESNIPFALSPIQKLFFERVTPMNHFNQSVVLQVQWALCKMPLEDAIRILVQRHSMLRARFHLANDCPEQWMQTVTDHIDESYIYRNHDGISLEEARRIRQLSQKSLNIRDGPLLAIECMAMTNGTQLVSLVAHHLVVDIVSWNILLTDLDEILTRGSLTLASPMPFCHWLQAQADQARDIQAPAVELCSSESSQALQYWGLETKYNCYKDAQQTGLCLSAEATSILFGPANDAFDTTPVELIHAALLYSFAKVFPDRQSPTIWSESHGRESSDLGLDLTRTVGWFTDIWPTCVEAVKGLRPQDFVARVKDARREAEKLYKRQYLAACYANHGTNSVSQLPEVFEILFNFAGPTHSESVANPSIRRISLEESPLADLDENATRFAVFDVWAEVVDSQLDIRIISNCQMRRSHAVVDWANSCKQTLLELTSLLPSTDSTLTRTDFPLLGLNDEQVHKFQRHIQTNITSRNLEVANAYRCSPMQRGILLGQAKCPENYIDRLRWRVQQRCVEPLDISRLIAAWQRVVDRHPMLRSVFVQSCRNDGSVDQVVLRKYEADVLVIQSCEEDPLQTLARAEEPPPMMELHPPHRLTVCVGEKGDIACLLTINHVAVDGLSGQIIFRDLKLAYDHTLELPADSVYQEYIAHLQRQPSVLANKYWLEYTDRMEPCLLPRPARIPGQDERDGVVQISLPESSCIVDFCQRNDVTVALLCQLAWGLVLRAYSGSDDVCFGYLTLGRDIPIPKIDDAVGPFINILVRRMSLDRDKTFLALLQQLQLEFVQGLDYQFHPLAEILHKHNQGFKGALFNTIVNVQKELVSYSEAEASIEFTGLEGTGPTEYDVTLDISLREQDIVVDFKYKSALLTRDQARHVLDAFGEGVLAVVRNPHHTAHTTSLLAGPSEELVLGWNNCALPCSVPQTPRGGLAEAIHRRCLAQPQAPAVCAWDGNFTYAELDSLSERMAATLTLGGAGPEIFVPVCFEKSRWTVVAILAVMKAGAAFILMDPSQPAKRLKDICKAARANLVLSSEAQAALAAGFGPRVLVLGNRQQPWTNVDESQCLQRRQVASLENALYAVFTSGSTGKPKGVVIEHRHYLSRVHEEIAIFKMGPGCRILQFAAYTWDVSILDHLHGMVSGSCLCIPSDTERLHGLAKATARMEANWTMVTPSMAQTMDPKDFPTLQSIHLGGERASQQVMQMWATRNLGVVYGPAECTPTSNHTWISHDHALPGTMGRPVQCRIWITHPDNCEILLPLGAVGEILIDGPCVGRGYIDEPEKTSMVFIDPPSWLRERYGHHCHRVYRTGDLAQYLADGTLVFHRRKDAQVKVRGQRVELGEVEFHLQQCAPDFNDIAVGLVQPDELGRRPLLVGFLHGPSTAALHEVTDSTSLSRPSAPFFKRLEQLRDDIAMALPRYMIPDVFFPLRRVPLTSSGKLDRKKLYQEVGSLSSDHLREYQAPLETKIPPGTLLEQMTVETVAQLLDLRPNSVGVNEHFFRLGGDSILAMRLIARTQEAGYEITMPDIFRCRDLRALAAAMKPSSSAVENPAIPPFSLLGEDATRETIISQAMQMCGLSRDSVEDIYPATPLQEGLMILSTKYPGKHVNQMVFELAADVDIQRFKAAWEATIAQSPILRTRLLHTDQDGMYQVVVRHLDSWHQFDDLLSYQTHLASHEMVLGESLIDLSIVQPSEDSQPIKFMLTLHHSVYDGWTMSLVWDQVQAAYKGRSLPVVPFKHLIHHMQINQADAIGFWGSQFIDLEAAVFPQLPSSRHVLNPASSFKHDIAELEGAPMEFTITTMVQLAWAIIISSYTDCDDVLFGVTVNGRNAPIPGIQQVVGPTIATVPLRVRLSSDKTIQESLASVSNLTTEMIPFQQLGLQGIRALGSDAARACDFQCHLGVQPPPSTASPTLIAGESSVHEDYAAFANYPLVVIYQLGDNGHDYVEVVHDEKVISLAAAQRIIRQFEHVLRQVRTQPEACICQLDLVCSEDKNQLYEWHKTLPPPYVARLHELVLANAIEDPQGSAIDAWDGALSYQELDRLSLGLAKRLSRLGVGRGSAVPLCMERSKWVIISMLAILRAGGTCVPLDPSHPPERTKEIVSRTAARLALTGPTLEDRFQHTAVRPIVIPTADEAFPQTGNLACADPLDPAFIMFTSGSTGKPKGILMDHKAICTSIRDHTGSLHLHRGVRALHFCSYAFDASLYEIFSVLVNGGCVCIPNENDRTNNLPGFIDNLNINWAVFAPSVLNSLLHPDQVPSLHTIVVGGEALTQDIVDLWAHRLTLVNGYGPAETTICAASQVPSQGWRTGTIGRVTGGVGWVVNSSDPSRMAPIGAMGELLMEGPVVTLGYLNDPERTAEAYIRPPPWIQQFRNLTEAGRFYRTGDLVQYTDDGGIQFCGRKDSQVKLNGQRVELAEVEYHTARCFPDVREVVAEIVYRDNNRRLPVLVVFLVLTTITSAAQPSGPFLSPDPDFDAAVDAAVTELRKRVPRFFIPGAFLQLAAMPRTSSGKINRRFLREQAAVHSLEVFKAKRSVHREPKTQTEQLLRDLWAGVVGRPSSGISAGDNFFDLGGDSVKAMKLFTLARPHGMALTLVDIFQHPTLSDLAQVAAGSRHNDDTYDYEPGSLLGTRNPALFVSNIPGCPNTINPENVLDVLPTTEFQSSLLDDLNTTYFKIALPPDVDLTRIEWACRRVVAHHPSLRTVFISHEGRDIQIILRHVEVSVVQITLQDGRNPEDAFQSIYDEDYEKPVMTGGSHLRIYLVSQSRLHHWLLIRASHAQLDYESALLFIKDISTIYAGQELHSEAPSFAQYLNYRLTHVPADATKFWRAYLEGSHLTSLPESTVPSPLSGHVKTQFTTTFKTIPFPSVTEGTTVATLTRAAWAFVLAQLTGETDVVFGHTLNGRDLPLPHAEEVPGPCVSVSPFRVTMQRSWTVRTLLHHVQQQYIRLMPFTSMDVQEIRRLVPTWPATGRLCSVCTYQNAGVARTVPFMDVECLVEIAQRNVTSPFHVTTGPHGDNELFVHLAVVNAHYQQPLVDRMGAKLCETIARFADDYDTCCFLE